MNKIIYSGISALALMLTACGGGSDAASCRFETQQNLDKGNFSAVITELSNPSSECRAAYNSDEWKIDLGAAYMGEAGLSVSDIIGLIGLDTGTGATYQTFINGVSAKQTPTALSSLDNAESTYVSALGANLCTDPSLTSSQKDICLYIGLAQTMLATTTINYLVDDIAALFDPTNPNYTAAKEEMRASVCALEFADSNSVCADASSVTGTDVVFTYSDASTRTFRDIVVTMSGTSTVYHKLGTASGVTPGTTVVTQGYCNNDFSNPSAVWNMTSSPYACPLNQDPTKADQNVTTLLVDTLDNGLDSVAGALAGDANLQQDINTYKSEIDTNSDGISISELQTYLNNL